MPRSSLVLAETDMVARSGAASLAPLDCSRPQHVTPQPGRSSGTLSGVPFDLFRLKAVFPDRWAGLLKAHFRNAAHVAVFFDCDEKTARNWLSGITGPSAPLALVAVARIPGAIDYLLRDAA